MTYSVLPRCLRTSRFLPLLILSLLSPWKLLAHTAAESPSFTLDPLTLDVSGTATFALKAASPNFLCLGTPEVEDAGTPSSIPIKIKADKPLKSGNQTLWLLHATASGVPAATSQQRYLRVKFDKHRPELVSYALTSPAAPTVKWDLQNPPASWSLAQGRAIPFAITVGPVAATNVHLVACTFVEKTNGRPLRCDQELCLTPTADAKKCEYGTNLQLAALTPRRLFLRVANSFKEPGSYIGTFTVGTSNATQEKILTSTPLTVNSTTWERRLLGILFILFGLGAAFWVTAYRRNRILRDQALIPALLLDGKLKEILSTLKKSPLPTKTWTPTATTEEIRLLRAQLDPRTLSSENFIPPSFPNPLKTADPNYATVLGNLNDPITVLQAIVHEGMQPFWTQWESADPQGRQALATALKKVDELAPGHLSLTEVRTEIATIQNQVNQPIQAAALAMAARVQQQRQTPTLTEVNLDITRLNLYGWFAWLLLTLLAGSILIWTNPAYGTLSDYIQSFLWTFGISAVGQQLSTLSIGSVSTALGIPLVK